jgi:hypothetical protein
MMHRNLKCAAGAASLLLLIWGAPGASAGEAKVAAGTLTPAAGPLTPEETVTRYLEALKAGNFAAAYDDISAGMAQHKSRDDWAKEQQWTMQMADAKIFDFHVYPGKIEGNVAHVPDLLSSQDKFLNQLGVQEHELYTLIREHGRWKIDQQQLLEKSERAKWFPPQAR